jgi:hypothetical protein
MEAKMAVGGLSAGEEELKARLASDARWLGSRLAAWAAQGIEY